MKYTNSQITHLIDEHIHNARDRRIMKLHYVDGLSADYISRIDQNKKDIMKLDDKWIPLIVGFCGGCLGVVGMIIMPGFPADNYIDAVAVGIASGLAATGAHQIGKQLSKPSDGGN